MADIRKETMGQIRALRRRIDPALLQRVRDAVYKGERSEKDNARAAVASFLDARDDGGAFRAKLEAELARHGRRLDALLPSDAAPPPPTASAKPPENLLSAPLTTKRKAAEKPKGFWRRFF